MGIDCYACVHTGRHNLSIFLIGWVDYIGIQAKYVFRSTHCWVLKYWTCWGRHSSIFQAKLTKQACYHTGNFAVMQVLLPLLLLLLLLPLPGYETLAINQCSLHWELRKNIWVGWYGLGKKKNSGEGEGGTSLGKVCSPVHTILSSYNFINTRKKQFLEAWVNVSSKRVITSSFVKLSLPLSLYISSFLWLEWFQKRSIKVTQPNLTAFFNFCLYLWEWWLASFFFSMTCSPLLNINKERKADFHSIFSR